MLYPQKKKPPKTKSPGRNVLRKKVFQTETCNPKLQDIWVKPFISFPIRAFLFICTEMRGSRNPSTNSLIVICPGRLLWLHLDSKQIQNGWQCLCSAGRNPRGAGERLTHHVPLCKGRRPAAPRVLDIWCEVGGVCAKEWRREKRFGGGRGRETEVLGGQRKKEI